MKHTQLAHLPITRISLPSGYIAFDVTVSGGLGGNITEEENISHANAIKILANCLLVAIRQINIKLYIVSFNSGSTDSKFSSVPSEAIAKIVIPKEDIENFSTLLYQCQVAIRKRYYETDPNVSISAKPSVWHSTVLSEESTHVLLASINAIPSGVIENGENNIGTVLSGKEEVIVSTYTRTDAEYALTSMKDNISKIFQLIGAKIENR